MGARLNKKLRKNNLTIIVRQVVLATVVELFLVTSRSTCDRAAVTVGLLTLPKASSEMIQLQVVSTISTTRDPAGRAEVLLLVARDHCCRGVPVIVLVVQVTRRGRQ